MANKEVSINGEQVLVKSGSGSNPLTYQMLTQWLTQHPEFFDNNTIPGITYDSTQSGQTQGSRST